MMNNAITLRYLLEIRGTALSNLPAGSGLLTHLFLGQVGPGTRLIFIL